MSKTENTGGSPREKLERLGFVSTDFGMKLSLGEVKLTTAEGPWGIVIWFTSIGKRSMIQYEVTAPYVCSDAAIARLILMNVAQNFKVDFDKFATHFRNSDLTSE